MQDPSPGRRTAEQTCCCTRPCRCWRRGGRAGSWPRRSRYRPAPCGVPSGPSSGLGRPAGDAILPDGGFRPSPPSGGDPPRPSPDQTTGRRGRQARTPSLSASVAAASCAPTQGAAGRRGPASSHARTARGQARPASGHRPCRPCQTIPPSPKRSVTYQSAWPHE